MFTNPQLPVTRTFYLTPDRTIESPSVGLLNIHQAIARILYLTSPGEYIDRSLRDMEDMEGGQVNSNGSSRLDDYVRYKFGGRLEETSVH